MASVLASTSSPGIRPGGPEDLDAVARLLTEVFAVDPLMRTVAAAAPKPVAALDHLHRCELAAHYLSTDASHRAGAHVDLAVARPGTPDERLLGVALWDAPTPGRDAPGSFGPELPDGLDRELLGGAWELVLLDAAQCETARPPQPYWYLYMLAVASAARDSGTGTALLRHGLERVDGDGVAAHLESTTPASRRLYERLGFTLAAPLDTPPLPVYWALTRPAHPRER